MTATAAERYLQSCLVVTTHPAARAWRCAVSREVWSRLCARPLEGDVTLTRAAPEEVSRARRGAGWIVELGVVDLAAVRAMVSSPRAGPTVVLTRDASSVVALVRCGARVCIDASSTEADVALAMLAATRGLSVWSTSLGERLREVVDEGGDAGPDDPRPTPREAEILALFARGLSYDEAARVLGVSANTVRSHVRSLYAKLEVVTKTEAVLAARRRGWIEAT